MKKKREDKFTRFANLCQQHGLNLVNTYCLMIPNEDTEQRKLVADLLSFKRELTNLYYTQ